MEIEKALLYRRSIRRYTPERIEPEIITELIRAAMYAPSAVNKRPWHFIVVDSRELMEKIMNVHPYSKMLGTASHAILVCGDQHLQHDEGYWIADCGAATQNLLLAAYGKGLGSCWIGLYPRVQRMKDISAIFNLPKHIFPFALVALGYPAEEKPLPERFEKEKIRWNGWED